MKYIATIIISVSFNCLCISYITMFLKDSQVSILPKYTTNDLGGDSYKYVSNQIGGKRKSKKSRYNKCNTQKRTNKRNKRTNQRNKSNKNKK